jgi:hypothetical protein
MCSYVQPVSPGAVLLVGEHHSEGVRGNAEGRSVRGGGEGRMFLRVKFSELLHDFGVGR